MSIHVPSVTYPIFGWLFLFFFLFSVAHFIPDTITHCPGLFFFPILCTLLFFCARILCTKLFENEAEPRPEYGVAPSLKSEGGQVQTCSEKKKSLGAIEEQTRRRKAEPVVNVRTMCRGSALRPRSAPIGLLNPRSGQTRPLSWTSIGHHRLLVYVYYIRSIIVYNKIYYFHFSDSYLA